MTETSTPAASSGSRVLRAILGLALVLPAAIACAVTQLAPTISTILLSFQKVALLRSGRSEFVGMTNYALLPEQMGHGGAAGMTLLVSAVRLAAVLIIPPLLALGIRRSLPILRIGTRLLLAIPLAAFAPLTALVAWLSGARPLASPDGMRGSLLLAEGLIALTAGCGVLTPVYLAALNQPAGAKTPRRSLAVIWVVSLLAVLALTPQGLVTSYVTGGGPARSTETLMLTIYRLAFQNIQIGPAAALSTLVLGLVIVVGIAAGLVIVLGGPGIQTTSAAPAERAGSGGSGPLLIGAAMLALAAGCVVVAALPYLVQSTRNIPTPAGMVDRVLGNFDLAGALALTILPQAAGVFLVQLPLAYLAALGIGAARPFGRRSELLLLPFSPWLFVIEGPLMISFFLAAQQARSLNTVVALLPRFALSIPMLFILTLFFKGQEAKRQASGGSFFRTVILPSLPLALLLGFAVTLVGMQSIEWPLVAVNSGKALPIPLVIVRFSQQFLTAHDAMLTLAALTEGPIALAWLVIFAVFLVFYVPRLAITRPDAAPEQEPPEAAGATPPAPAEETHETENEGGETGAAEAKSSENQGGESEAAEES